MEQLGSREIYGWNSWDLGKSHLFGMIFVGKLENTDQTNEKTHHVCFGKMGAKDRKALCRIWDAVFRYQSCKLRRNGNIPTFLKSIRWIRQKEHPGFKGFKGNCCIEPSMLHTMPTDTYDHFHCRKGLSKHPTKHENNPSPQETGRNQTSSNIKYRISSNSIQFHPIFPDFYQHFQRHLQPPVVRPSGIARWKWIRIQTSVAVAAWYTPAEKVALSRLRIFMMNIWWILIHLWRTFMVK